MDNRISAVSAPGYQLERLIPAVGRQLDDLEIWDDLRPGMRVTIKPNLLAKYAPDRAVTTHPAVVEAVVRVLQDHRLRDITLADSPGGPYSAALLQSIYRASGMAGVAERTGMKLNLDTGSRPLPAPEAVLCSEFSILGPVAEADFVIDLCKLKTHAMVGYSGAVKNLFGCVPGLQKPELHFRFPEKGRFCRMLVDLAELVRPGLALMDAVVAMEGDGPSAGEPRPVGLLFAARNPHVLDLGVGAMIGLGPDDVFTLRHAVDTGLCPGSPDEIQWLGDGKPEPIPDFRHPASKSPATFSAHVPGVFRRPLRWVEQRFLTPRPVIAARECIGCGKCAESCAPEAIAIRDGKAVLDRSRCIRCYCCHEMCPVKAVKIHRPRVLRI